MTIFVDASALVAIIAGEQDAESLVSRLDGDADRRTSAVAIWEAAVGLARVFAMEPRVAQTLVRHFLQASDIVVEAIDERVAVLALEAFQQFGKGRHPASLNMGDCFAYACARALGGTLLYKGDDFSKTDLAFAL